MREVKASNAALVTVTLERLSRDTGMPVEELRDLWLSETADRLARATGSLDLGDFRETARHAHSAAGTSGMCGAPILAALLSDLERLAADERRIEAQQTLAWAREDFAQLTRDLKRGSS